MRIRIISGSNDVVTSDHKKMNEPVLKSFCLHFSHERIISTIFFPCGILMKLLMN